MKNKKFKKHVVSLYSNALYNHEVLVINLLYLYNIILQQEKINLGLTQQPKKN